MPRLATRKINSSLKSSGSLSVAIASNASINVLGDASTTQYSWGCRAKLSPDNAAATVFFSKASTKYALQLRIESGGKVRAAIYDGVNSTIVQSANTYTDNEWHTFVGVRDGTSLKLYIDGSLAASTTGTINDTNESSGIGMFGNGTKGVFSEGFVTLTAMTATEVMNHEINNTLPASCLVILPCNEGAGSIAYDSSGNANDATITSPTWTRETFTKIRKAVNNNLVVNGDFEIAPLVNVAQATASSNWLDGTSAGSTTNNTFGWRKFNYTGSQHAYFDSTEKYSGQYSLRLSTLGTGATVGVTNATSATLDPFTSIPCIPNTSYTLSFWMKTNVVSGSATSGAFLRLSAGNVSDSTKIKTTTGWTQYTVAVTTGATTSVMSVELRIIGNDGTGTLIMDAWFDEITFNKTTPQARTAVTFPQRKTPDNLLSNGNFEYAPPFTAATNFGAAHIDGTAAGSTTNNQQHGWSTIAGFTASSAKTCRFDTSTYHSGAASMLVSLDNTIADLQVWSGGRTTSRQQAEAFCIKALPNTSYTISGWIKVDKSAGTLSDGVYIVGSERDGLGVNTLENVTTKFTSTTDWTFVTSTFTTGSTTRYIGVKLRVSTASTATVNAWFDDITLTKVPADARTVVS